MPVNTSNIPTVTWESVLSKLYRQKLTTQLPLFLCSPEIPDLDQPIISSSDELLIIRTPSYTMTSFPVPLEPMYIGQMRSKVLDRTRLVRRD